MTTLQQTVEIPADHRLTLDLLVPQEIPAGTASFRIEWIKPPVKPQIGLVSKKHTEFAKNIAEIRQLCKSSSVTVDSFLEERRKERDIEEADVSIRRREAM